MDGWGWTRVERSRNPLGHITGVDIVGERYASYVYSGMC